MDRRGVDRERVCRAGASTGQGVPPCDAVLGLAGPCVSAVDSAPNRGRFRGLRRGPGGGVHVVSLNSEASSETRKSTRTSRPEGTGWARRAAGVVGALLLAWAGAARAAESATAGVTGGGTAPEAAPGARAGRGDKGAGFALKRFPDGREVKLSDFAGKIVLLDFFAHWCVTCAKSAPVVEAEIQKHYEKKGGNPRGVKVQVVSINVEPGERRSTEAFIKKHGVSLVLNDRDGATLAGYGGTSLPYFVILDGTKATSERPEFTVVHRSDTFEGAAKLRGLIDGLGAATAGSSGESLKP